MTNDYLTGYLAVFHGIDVVQLVHQVNGRVSFMELIEGDHIEVVDDDELKIISVSDALNEEHNQNSWKCGKSLYQDSHVRVKLDVTQNKIINNAERHYKIHEVLTYLKDGVITQAEAEILLVNINLEG